MRDTRTIRRAIGAVLLFVITALPSASQSLCSFSAPTTDLANLFLTLNYTYLNIPDTPTVDVSSGRVSFTFSYIHDEPDWAFSASSANELSFEHFRLDRVLGDATLTTRYYFPLSPPLYVFSEVKSDYTTAIAQTGLELRLGAGIGRLSDVTPLARAIRIDALLQEDLVLIVPLRPDTLQTIAQLISQESSMAGIGELVGRIEAVIEGEAGVTLNARSLLAIAEQIRADVVSQRCGWATQAGIGYELIRRFGGSRQLLLTVSSTFARPLSLASQVGINADFSYPLFVGSANALTASAHYNRRLSSTTRLVAEYALQRLQQSRSEVNVGERIDVQLLFDLGRVDLTITASLSRGTGMPGWIESLAVSADVDLL